MSIVTIEEAVRLLRDGEVVSLPTETVYGLAGRIDSPAALEKIFAVKKRPFFDPLIVHVGETEAARALASVWPEIYDVLAREFWPGPLTLIAKKTPMVSPRITSGLDTVALRCPAHPLALEVLKRLGIPLAAPSANRFGRTSPTLASHVENEFAGEVPVLDGGPCTVGVESTVLRAEHDGTKWQVRVLRPGGVARAQLRKVLDDEGVPYELTRESSSASPGHLPAHYQPISPLILLSKQKWSHEVQRQVEQHLGRPLHGANEIRLATTAQESARVLYTQLRETSSDANHALWIERNDARAGEEWEAIWDRVERAASLVL